MCFMAKKQGEKPKKKKKKPKHTNLVTPGSTKRKNTSAQPNRSVYRAATGIEPDQYRAQPPQPPQQQQTQRAQQPAAKAPQPTGEKPFDVTTAEIDENAMADVMATSLQRQNTTTMLGVEAQNKTAGQEQNSGQTLKKKPKGQTTQFPAVKTGASAANKENKKKSLGKKSTQKKKEKKIEELPPNAKKMPTAKERHKMAVKAGRRKKRMRWIRFLAGVGLAIALILAYFAGIYSSIIQVASNTIETIRIDASGGPGFPVDFTVSGFLQAKSMGNNGIAALGDKDMAILSSQGKELLRVQHGYTKPSIVTGQNRVCIFNRGNSEYIVTNRTKVLQKTNADGDVLFAELSDNGSLLLATASQYRSSVDIYSPTSYDKWRWSWSSAEDIPISAVFASNNTTMALACLTPENAAISSTIYVFNTNKSADKGAQLAKITNSNGIPVQMLFIGNKLLVVYDTGSTVLYDKKGNEISRYNYDGAVLHTASLTTNGVALLFGSALQDNAHLVYLDKSLQVLGDTRIENVLVSQVLAGKNGVYALGGQEVFGFSKDLTQRNTLVEHEKNYSIVWGGKPILLSAAGAQSLEALTDFKAGSGQTITNTASLKGAETETTAQENVESKLNAESEDPFPEMG